MMNINSTIITAFIKIINRTSNEWISLKEIYEEVHTLNPNIAEETIRRTIFNHCEQSDAFVDTPC